MRAFRNSSELSACSIHSFLLADVCSDLLQFEPYGRYRVTAAPEMLARELPFLTAQTGDWALFPFINSITETTGCLGRIAMHM